MKLRKQSAAKAVVAAASAGMFLLFWLLVRADPQTSAETPAPSINYDRFFAPAAGAVPQSPPPVQEPRPHTRTRAS
jgi:hypothetical protein